MKPPIKSRAHAMHDAKQLVSKASEAGVCPVFTLKGPSMYFDPDNSNSDEFIMRIFQLAELRGEVVSVSFEGQEPVSLEYDNHNDVTYPGNDLSYIHSQVCKHIGDTKWKEHVNANAREVCTYLTTNICKDYDHQLHAIEFHSSGYLMAASRMLWQGSLYVGSDKVSITKLPDRILRHLTNMVDPNNMWGDVTITFHMHYIDDRITHDQIKVGVSWKDTDIKYGDEAVGYPHPYTLFIQSTNEEKTNGN